MSDDQYTRIKHALLAHPAPAGVGNVRALLLRRVQSFSKTAVDVANRITKMQEGAGGRNFRTDALPGLKARDDAMAAAGSGLLGDLTGALDLSSP